MIQEKSEGDTKRWIGVLFKKEWRTPRSTQGDASAASNVYKRQGEATPSSKIAIDYSRP